MSEGENMSWLYEHHSEWRIALLVMMIVAFLGPWTVDLIYMPSEYECSAPFVRLEGDFCGIPLSGIRIFFWISGGLAVGLETGEVFNSERIREFLFMSLFLLLPLLPIFSTLLLILRGDHPRRQVFTIIAWILAIGVGLFLGMSNSIYPRLFWAVWGIWLYIGLAISALTLEILVILSNREDPEGLADVESVLS